MGVMRVGALARGLMLRGERQMEVVLMMKSMYTRATLFQDTYMYHICVLLQFNTLTMISVL